MLRDWEVLVELWCRCILLMPISSMVLYINALAYEVIPYLKCRACNTSPLTPSLHLLFIEVISYYRRKWITWNNYILVTDTTRWGYATFLHTCCIFINPNYHHHHNLRNFIYLSICLCSETFPSGCLTLDFALGGGLPKGRIVEVSDLLFMLHTLFYINS